MVFQARFFVCVDQRFVSRSYVDKIYGVVAVSEYLESTTTFRIDNDVLIGSEYHDELWLLNQNLVLQFFFRN